MKPNKAVTRGPDLQMQRNMLIYAFSIQLWEGDDRLQGEAGESG